MARNSTHALQPPADAEQVFVLTMDEAQALPGFLGRFVTARFRHYGFYSCLLDGKKTLYLLKTEKHR